MEGELKPRRVEQKGNVKKSSRSSKHKSAGPERRKLPPV
jgi:hypothetical protein